MPLRRLILLSLLCTAPLAADYREHEEEMLFARRIVEFWKEHDYPVVRQQVLKFLEAYPQSQFRDSFLAMLGDTYWREYNYKEALTAYDLVQDASLKTKVRTNRFDCLYHLGNSKQLMSELKPLIGTIGARPQTPEEELFFYFYAEALLKEAKEIKNPAYAENYQKKARRYYNAILTTGHQTNALLGLAELDKLQGKSDSAVRAFKQLAEQHPEKKEELLYQAAQLQAAASPDEALATLSEVQNLKGKLSSRATLAKLHLLYDQKQYKKIIDEAPAISAALSVELRPLVPYYVGHSHFALNNLDKSRQLLEPLVKQPGSFKPAQMKTILITLMAIGYRQGDPDSVERWADRLEQQYPGDPIIAKAHYIRSLTYKQQKKPLQALAYMNKALVEHPEFDKREHAEFEKNVLLLENGDYQKSRDGFKQFLAQHPNSRYCQAAAQYLPKCTMVQIEKEPSGDLQQQLIDDLQMVVDNRNALTPEQRPQFQFALAKALYDSGRYEEAIGKLESSLAQSPKDPGAYKAHLLLAMAHLQGNNDEQLFINHAEQALELKPELPNSDALHQQLFNAYIRRAKAISLDQCSQSREERNGLLGKASEHLYQALHRNPLLIPDTNRLWLAHYYYDLIKNSQNEHMVSVLHNQKLKQYAERSQEAFLLALHKTEGSHAPRIAKGEMSLEEPLYYLSNLYGWLDKKSQRKELLDDLTEQYAMHPQWAWKKQDNVRFAWACCLAPKEAAPHLLALADQKIKDPSLMAAIQLQSARSLLSAENQDADRALSMLRDLRTHRKLSQEPAHLEAALDYARFTADRSEPENRQQRYLDLLKEAKQEFSDKEGVWAKDYQHTRKLYPDKESLYLAYMMLLDAHIANTEGNIHKNPGKQEAARMLYQKIAKGE